MEIRTFIMTIGVCLSCSGLMFATDDAKQLPNDGWWIRYSATTTLEYAGKINESPTKFTLTYSLVGTAIEDGEKCRWVELVDSCPMPDTNEKKDRKSVVVSKLLVPEKDLLESEQPLDKVKRVWKKIDRSEAKLASPQRATISGNPNLMIFPGFWQKTAKENKERAFEYQQGRLALSQAQVRQDSMPTVINRPRNSYFRFDANEAPSFRLRDPRVVEYTAWFDRTIAPVFVAAKIKQKFYVDDELKGFIEDDIVVEDYGTDAKSQLPDNN